MTAAIRSRVDQSEAEPSDGARDRDAPPRKCTSESKREARPFFANQRDRRRGRELRFGRR
jgi:hypothetical protein